jgi:hypothetical protein
MDDLEAEVAAVIDALLTHSSLVAPPPPRGSDASAAGSSQRQHDDAPAVRYSVTDQSLTYWVSNKDITAVRDTVLGKGPPAPLGSCPYPAPPTPMSPPPPAPAPGPCWPLGPGPCR